jgi:signal transduction histidine kinase
MGPQARAQLGRYGVAVLGVALAFAVRQALDPLLGDLLPMLTFCVAVLVVAWHGGFGPSLSALALGGLAAAFFFMSPRYDLVHSVPAHRYQVTGFLFLGVCISVFSEGMAAARRRAEDNAREALRRGAELELEIARRQQLEQELNERNRELADADRRKDEFLAMLGHELRNPLAPIRNAIRLLQMMGPADPQLQLAREVIDRQSRHLSRLVEDLLDVSRISRGKVSLQWATIKLADVVNNAVESSGPLLDARRHELKVSLPAEDLRVVGDGVRLAQVLANLLNNAGKYTPEGGHIEVGAERDGGTAVLRVRDDGVGIAPDMLSRIFELFAQADVTLARAAGGLGIGLTVARRLVELHGGTLSAASAGPGHGSEFVLRLPLAHQEPDAAEEKCTVAPLSPAP